MASTKKIETRGPLREICMRLIDGLLLSLTLFALPLASLAEDSPPIVAQSKIKEIQAEIQRIHKVRGLMLELRDLTEKPYPVNEVARTNKFVKEVKSLGISPEFVRRPPMNTTPIQNAKITLALAENMIQQRLQRGDTSGFFTSFNRKRFVLSYQQHISDLDVEGKKLIQAAQKLPKQPEINVLKTALSKSRFLGRTALIAGAVGMMGAGTASAYEASSTRLVEGKLSDSTVSAPGGPAASDAGDFGPAPTAASH